MPSRNPYGCVFCPTYLLAFFVVCFFLAGAFFFAFARGCCSAFASAFGAAGGGATGASVPATRISTWLVRLRIGLPPPPPPAPQSLLRFPSFSTPSPPAR